MGQANKNWTYGGTTVMNLSISNLDKYNFGPFISSTLLIWRQIIGLSNFKFEVYIV